eukprot:scaffold4190_cov78-Skeletonema_marinoi.AAC.2
MKLATAVTSLVTIIGANGRTSTSTASTKSSKSNTSCIESKSGKALSLSSKSGKASGSCAPCSFGSGIIYNTTLCGTDAGFCEFRGEDFPPIVDACDANNCVPDCDYLEPQCQLCSFGPIYGVNCPQPEPGSNQVACEISVSADAEPTCVVAECVPRYIEPACGLCTTAPQEYDCPVVDGFCQVDLLATGYDCASCGETACPDFTFDQCVAPPEDETDARRLEMVSNRKDDDIFSRDVVEVMRLKTRRTCVVDS